MPSESRWAQYIHQMSDGRWIVAHWDERKAQWQSSNSETRGGMGQSYCFTFARRLEGLAKNGIRTYLRRGQALRAARRCYL